MVKSDRHGWSGLTLPCDYIVHISFQLLVQCHHIGSLKLSMEIGKHYDQGSKELTFIIISLNPHIMV
jgi:hypothetical protein